MKTREIARYGSRVTLLDIPTITLPPPPPPPPPPNPTLLFDGRFHTNPPPFGTGADRWALLDSTDAGNSNQATYVLSPRRRSSEYAAKLQVGGPELHGERLEFQKEVFAGPIQHMDIWLAFSMRPESSISLALFANLMQRYTKYDSSAPAPSPGATGIQCYIPTGEISYRWVTGVSNGAKTWHQPNLTTLNGGHPNVADITGKWTDWLIRTKFERTAGITEVWYRAATTGATDNPTMGSWSQLLNDTTSPTYVYSPTFDADLLIRHGLYKPGNRVASYAVVEQSGLVIANTRADAEAGAFA